MSSSYEAKNELVSGRQLKVQSLCIPLSIVGSATTANVVCRNDEPGFMFLKTQGVDQITGALSSGETATYSTAPNDANGIFNVLIKIGEPILKVCGSYLVRRDPHSASQFSYLGSSSGITTGSGGGESIMLACDSDVALNAGNTLDACLYVEYIVNEGA